nr:hypothetical protein Iba_chr05dCG7950 [Ipomoea batatas]
MARRGRWGPHLELLVLSYRSKTGTYNLHYREPSNIAITATSLASHSVFLVSFQNRNRQPTLQVILTIGTWEKATLAKSKRSHAARSKKKVAVSLQICHRRPHLPDTHDRPSIEEEESSEISLFFSPPLGGLDW